MSSVLQVVLSLHPGGTERLVVELAKRLHATVPMAVCCLDEAGAWSAELESCGIRVHALGRQPGFQPKLGHAISEIARTHGATVLHAHQYSPFVYSAVARLRHPSLRIVFTEHGRLSDAPPSGKRQIANWLLRRLPHRVYAVSDNLRQHVVGEGFTRAQVGVIYNGIDIGPLPSADTRVRFRKTVGVSDDTFLIGTIARLDPVKDLETLLRAIALLNEPKTTATRPHPVSLVVLGSGPEGAALAQAAAKLGIGHRVFFAGHQDDARAWLAGCDAYANSSISEGVSLTILEAMAAGLPVVATAVGGTPEVVNDTCGRLVPARSPEAIAMAVLDLVQSPATRIALGTAARRRVETHFTLDRMIDEYRQVYGALSYDGTGAGRLGS